MLDTRYVSLRAMRRNGRFGGDVVAQGLAGCRMMGADLRVSPSENACDGDGGDDGLGVLARSWVQVANGASHDVCETVDDETEKHHGFGKGYAGCGKLYERCLCGYVRLLCLLVRYDGLPS